MSKQGKRNRATIEWENKDREHALERRRAARRKYVKSHPLRVKETQRFAQIKLLYGLTKDEYYELLEDYLNRCAICESTEKLVIDHCHKTNKIRGVLCTMCNSALGYARENIDVLRNLIVYLDLHNRN